MCLFVFQIDDIFSGSSVSSGVNGKENSSSSAVSQLSRVSPYLTCAQHGDIKKDNATDILPL